MGRSAMPLLTGSNPPLRLYSFIHSFLFRSNQPARGEEYHVPHEKVSSPPEILTRPFSDTFGFLLLYSQ